MSLMDVAGALVQVLLVGIAIWIIKADTTAIRKRMDCFEKTQHACQIDNERRFATWEQHNGLDHKVDDHEVRITKLESKKD